MSKESRNLIQRKNIRKKFGFLRFLVIMLSFISLISRIIYCTFATWLTITTFDCIPCLNSTPANGSSDLFIAHHSSAVFKTVRALNIESAQKSRRKRSQDVNNSDKFSDTYSQFFANDHINHQQNHTIDKLSPSLHIQDSGQHIRHNSVSENSGQLVDDLIPKNPEIEDFLNNKSYNRTDVMSTFFGDEAIDPLVVPVVSSIGGKSNNETSVERFTYIPSDDLLNIVRNLTNSTNSDTNTIDTIDTTTASKDGSKLNTMTINLDENLLNQSNIDQKRKQKRLFYFQEMNETSNLTTDMKKTQMNVCSEDCAQFLNIELSDPDVRKWATIVITGVLYLYAFVMFCIFVSSCLALVDLLVVTTFIEGAKLFAGFILIVIDSFNGKEIHFDLIDIKFKVNSGGNGWTADFSYSEYLLDIVIFFLSVLLCIRVFKCLEKKPKKVSSVEELVDNSRGTYRPNHSRNSLEPIYEHN